MIEVYEGVGLPELLTKFLAGDDVSPSGEQ
jgi:hypothetical protein